jgi:hypothetical protein
MTESQDDQAAAEELRLAFGRAIGFTLAALLRCWAVASC